jgi:hypothetical protein
MPRVLVTLLFVYSLGGIGIAATDVWANDIRNERLQSGRRFRDRQGGLARRRRT